MFILPHKPGFNSTWIVNFQTFKLDLEKAEELEIKLPKPAGSSKKQESSRKTSTSALLTMPKPLTVWIPQTVENSSRDGNTRPPYLSPEKPVCRSRSNSVNWTWNSGLIPDCASLSPVFLMIYSAYNLNKQGDNIQAWCTPFPIWNQSVVPCPVLTVAFWPAYRFLYVVHWKREWQNPSVFLPWEPHEQ